MAASPSKRLRSYAFGIRRSTPDPRGQAVEFRRIGQRGLQSHRRAHRCTPSKSNMFRRPPSNANPLAFVVQLPLMAGRACEADPVALSQLSRPSVNDRLGDADRKPVRIESADCGLRDQAVASLLASDRNSSWLPATSRFRKMS